MKTHKHNKLKKKRLTKNIYLTRKRKLIHRIKKGGNPKTSKYIESKSIKYIKESIIYYKSMISNPFLFDEETKVGILKTFKYNIDNIHLCAQALDLLYTDLEEKNFYKDKEARDKVYSLFVDYMWKLKNNVMMRYGPTKDFYNNTKCYLYNDPKNCYYYNNVFK